MIKYLILNKRPYVWIIIHLLLGVSATITPVGVIIWFYLILTSSFFLVLKNERSPFVGMSLILYLISFELLSRMAFTSPYVPYELGKYLVFVGMIWGFFQYKTYGYLGWVMLLCMIPSLFFDLSGQVAKADLVFNVLGPINVALVVIFFYKQKITQHQFGSLIRLMVYPILGVMSYTFIKTPDFSEVDFVLGANVELSGGFGSNQVSTLFGLGALLMFILMVNRWRFSGNFFIDGGILFSFTFQGLLTFSRGGMIGTALGVGIILVFLRFASAKDKRLYRLPKIGKFVIPALLITVAAFVAVDYITNGLLSLRYQGETMGTLEGSKVKSMYTITTGRLDIFMGDVDLWLDHFIFGVGAASSRFLRDGLDGTVAHVELSRLLAEHGALGLIYFVTLCFLGIQLLRAHPNPLIKAILISLFVVAIYTTFHAAMRTYVTPALIGLSLLSISNPKPKRENSLPRKQAKGARLQPNLH